MYVEMLHILKSEQSKSTCPVSTQVYDSAKTKHPCNGCIMVIWRNLSRKVLRKFL